MLSAFEFRCKGFARYKKFSGTSIIYSHLGEEVRGERHYQCRNRVPTQDL